MEADGLTESDVAESIINAVAIYKRLRSRSRFRSRRVEYLQEGAVMPQTMRAFQVTVCPSCGSTSIHAMKGDWCGSYRGKQYMVKDLRYFQCPRCGEKVYDPAAMRRNTGSIPGIFEASAGAEICVVGPNQALQPPGFAGG
jgi:YgiT-type zinc finger domain-containing protein